jgi:hypothetical protein
VLPWVTLYLYNMTMQHRLENSQQVWLNWFVNLAQHNGPLALAAAIAGWTLRLMFKRYALCPPGLDYSASTETHRPSRRFRIFETRRGAPLQGKTFRAFEVLPEGGDGDWPGRKASADRDPSQHLV